MRSGQVLQKIAGFGGNKKTFKTRAQKARKKSGAPDRPNDGTPRAASILEALDMAETRGFSGDLMIRRAAQYAGVDAEAVRAKMSDLEG